MKKNKSKKTKKIRKIILKPLFTDDKMDKKEGHYFSINHYNHIIKENCDAYRVDNDGNLHLLLKFRKNVIPKKECKIGMISLKKAAMKKHDNRGAPAGLLDPKKMANYVNDIKLHGKKEKFRIDGYYSKKTKKFVNNSMGNISQSNIIGYFDKSRNNNISKSNISKASISKASISKASISKASISKASISKASISKASIGKASIGKASISKANISKATKKNVPCRETAFTRDEVEKWKNVQPLLKSIDKQFKKIIPDRHKIQYDTAQKTPYNIKGTAFSTVTINYNFRTALHKDKGDFERGFGNLVVLEEGKYGGGYTGFPQYGICVDVREGDFLGMDVHQYHCNTKISPKTKDYTRLSLVAYLRNKMIKCKKGYK
jgi:hypothetical protein